MKKLWEFVVVLALLLLALAAVCSPAGAAPVDDFGHGWKADAGMAGTAEGAWAGDACIAPNDGIGHGLTQVVHVRQVVKPLTLGPIPPVRLEP